jgi:hypothetical protein
VYPALVSHFVIQLCYPTLLSDFSDSVALEKIAPGHTLVRCFSHCDQAVPTWSCGLKACFCRPRAHPPVSLLGPCERLVLLLRVTPRGCPSRQGVCVCVCVQDTRLPQRKRQTDRKREGGHTHTYTHTRVRMHGRVACTPFESGKAAQEHGGKGQQERERRGFCNNKP